MRAAWLYTGWVLSGILMFQTEAYSFCAMCRKALEESGGSLIQGFYWSIVLLTGLPILIFIILAGVYMNFKRKAEHRA